MSALLRYQNVNLHFRFKRIVLFIHHLLFMFLNGKFSLSLSLRTEIRQFGLTHEFHLIAILLWENHFFQ